MRKVVAQISLALFFFFAPINFYIIGNSRGFGIQTIFFRFQITDIGPSFITFIRDFQLILEDYIHGITAMSYIAWTTGVFFIIFCLISIL
ncbi:MAG: hypothetical protein JXR87_04830, partial [Candidatus Marinimicrobia bacterium]|nr:hypothetical protein [Candidatus Neomarinimicrobiota bacterium]